MSELLELKRDSRRCHALCCSSEITLAAFIIYDFLYRLRLTIITNLARSGTLGLNVRPHAATGSVMYTLTVEFDYPRILQPHFIRESNFTGAFQTLNCN